MKFLLGDENKNLFSEIELLVTLGVFCYLITEFSFGIVSVLIIKSDKLFKRKLDYINTNLIGLRIMLFGFSSIMFFILTVFLDFSVVKFWYVICLFILAAVFDVGWLYLLKDKFHAYFFNTVFLKNIIFFIFIFIFRDELNQFYLLGFVTIPLILNILVYLRSQLVFKFRYLNLKFVYEIFTNGYQIVLSDVVISAYSYLDVYFVVLLLSPIDSVKYLVVRKIVKGLTSLLGQLPKILLKEKLSISKGTKNMQFFFIVIVILFFVLYNSLSSIFYDNILNVNSMNLNNLSFLFSFLIILGPIQNLYLQTVILKNGLKSVYLKSYTFGLFFFLSFIFIFYYFNILTLYKFALIRIMSDVVIISYSSIKKKIIDG